MGYFAENSLHLVLGIALLAWAGIFFYLRRLDRKISKLEKRES